MAPDELGGAIDALVVLGGDGTFLLGASLVADQFKQIDDLIAWARGQPRTPASRAEILSRYFAIIASGRITATMM